MAVAAQLDVIMGGDNSGAIAAISGTDRALVGAGAAMGAWGTVGLAAIKSWVTGAMGMEQSFANIAAITGQTIPAATAEFTNQVNQLAVTYGKSSQDIVTGLYDIVQANYSGADASAILTAATKGAAAGLTDTTVATDGLTTVLSAYANGVSGTALKVADLDRINDVMFQTVATGKVSYEELNRQWGDTAPLASQLGISIEELGAAYAMTTNQGVSASEVSTQLGSIMTGLLKPSTALTSALQEHGYQSGLDLVQQEGLAGALKFVNEATGGQSDALAELFPNIRATRGLTALLNGDFDSFLKTMEGATEVIDPVTGEVIKLGATEAALGKITDTTGFQFGRMKASIGVLANAFGAELLPFVRMGAEAITGLVVAFTKLPGSVKSVIAIFTALASVALIVAGAWIGATALFAGIGAALLAVVPPILIVAAVVAVLATAWSHNWFDIQGKVGTAVDFISVKLGALAGWLSQFVGIFNQFNAGMNPVAAALHTVGAAFNQLAVMFPVLAPVLGFLGQQFHLLGTMANDLALRYAQLRSGMNPVSALFKSLGDVLKKYAASFGPLAGAVGLLGNAFAQIGKAAGDFGDVLQAAMEGNWREALYEARDTVFDLGRAFVSLWGVVPTAVLGLLGKLLSDVGLKFYDLASGITGPFGAALSSLGDGFMLLSGAVNDVKDALGKLLQGDWSGALGKMGDALDLVGLAFHAFGNAAVDGLRGAWDALSNVDWGSAFGSLADAAGGAASSAWSALTGAIGAIPWDTLGDYITGAATWLLTTGGQMIQGLINGAIERFPTFTAWLGSMASMIGGAISDAASWLKDKGTAAIQGLIDGAIERFPTFSAWLGTIGSIVLGAIVGAGTWLLNAGRQLIQGLIDGAIERFPTLSAWLSGLGGTISGLVTGAIGWLKSAGSDVISGFFSAIGEAWGPVANWLQTIGTLIAATVPGLVGAIASKGTDLITGFGGAVSDAWDSFKTWLTTNITGSAITDAIGTISIPDNPFDPLLKIFDGVIARAEDVIGKIAEVGSGLLGHLGIGGGDGGDSDSTGLTVQQYQDLTTTLEGLQGRISTAVTAISGSLATLSMQFTLTASNASLSSSTVKTSWGTDVPQAFTDAGTGVTNALNAIQVSMGLFATQAGAFGTSAALQFNLNLTTGLTSAATGAGIIIDGIQTKLGTFVSQAGAFGTAAGNIFKVNLMAGLNAAQAEATNALSALTSRMRQFASEAGNAGQQAGSTFRSGIQSGMSASVSIVISAVNQMKSAMSFNAYSQGLTAGSSFGQGAVAGATAYIGAMNSAGVALANAVVAGFNSVSKPGSPSRTARKQGGQYGEGLYVGAMAWAEPIANAGRLLAGGLSAQTDAVFTASTRSGSAVNSMMAGNVTNIYNALSSEELQRLIANAERGGGFVDNVSRNARAGLSGVGVRVGA